MTATIHYFESEMTSFELPATDDSAMYVRLLLARHEPLLALPLVLLDALAFAFVEKEYLAGQPLIQPGDRRPCVFLIVHGEVAVVDEAGTRSRRCTGQFVSSLSCLEGRAEAQSCVAAGPLRVASLSGPAVGMLFGTNSEIGQALRSACQPQACSTSSHCMPPFWRFWQRG